MVYKQTLIIKEKLEDEIVILAPHFSSYVDEDYFKQLGEDPNNRNFKTFSVNFECIRVDWIINEEIGLEFLNAILKSKN